MKRLAAGQTIVVVPVIVEPVEVHDPAVVVPVEVRDVEVAVGVAQNYAACRPCHRPLSTLGVESYSET
jgi:hypothetical protein